MKTNKFYQYQKIILENGDVADGDYITTTEDGREFTVRCSDGFLDDVLNDETGELLPAFEMSDSSHIEHWKNGALHCEDGPAVIDVVDGREEWWENGKFIKEENLL